MDYVVFSSRSLNNGLILPHPDFSFRHYTCPPHHQGLATMDPINGGLKMLKKKNSRDFLGLRFYTSTAGDVGSIPDQGARIPCAVGQLSLCAATAEPVHHNGRPP